MQIWLAFPKDLGRACTVFHTGPAVIFFGVSRRRISRCLGFLGEMHQGWNDQLRSHLEVQEALSGPSE